MRYLMPVLLLLITVHTRAQFNATYNFKHIDQSDGLLHPQVLAIGQDKQGYMWILSLNGLQRFDGNRFVDYPEIVHHTLPGEMGSCDLSVDTVHNQILVRKTYRQDQFDLLTKKIKSVRSMDYLLAHADLSKDVYTNPNGKQWLMSTYGFAQFEHNIRDAEVCYLNYFVGQDDQAQFLIRDPSTGFIWAHSFDKIVYGDPATHQVVTAFTIRKNASGLGGRFIFLDQQHNLWVTTWSGYFYRYNLDTKELREYSLAAINFQHRKNLAAGQGYMINAILEDRQQQLWFGTDNAGLLKYDRVNDSF